MLAVRNVESSNSGPHWVIGKVTFNTNQDLSKWDCRKERGKLIPDWNTSKFPQNYMQKIMPFPFFLPSFFFINSHQWCNCKRIIEVILPWVMDPASTFLIASKLLLVMPSRNFPVSYSVLTDVLFGKKSQLLQNPLFNFSYFLSLLISSLSFQYKVLLSYIFVATYFFMFFWRTYVFLWEILFLKVARNHKIFKLPSNYHLLL